MLESREAAGNVARRRDATLVRATGFAVPRGIVVRWTKLIFGFCTDLKPIEPMSLVSFQRSLGDVKKNTLCARHLLYFPDPTESRCPP